MRTWGTGLVIFAVLSIGCARSVAPEARAAEPAAESEEGEQPSQAAPPPPAEPAAAPLDQAPSSTKDEADALGQAIAEFDRAQLELSGLLGRDLNPRPREAAPTGGAAAERSAPPATAPKAAADKSTSSRAEAAAPLKKGDDGCVNVCRAFDSLTRSAAAVCRLDEGERCRRANDVVAVAKADAGVKACACKR